MDMVTMANRSGAGAALLLAVLLAASACGPSAEQQRREQAEKDAARAVEEAGKKIAEAGRQAEKGSAEMARGLEAMAKGLGALAGSGENKPVEPVSFHDLQGVFPEVSGWEKGKPTGEKMSSPVPFSKASVVYRNGDAKVEATLVDSGFNQLLLLPYMWIQHAGYEKETEHGYEKSVKVAGFPGFEKWNAEGRDGELNAFVQKRYILQLEGRNIADLKVLHQFAQAADLGKLASLK
jgi:hypothetical protein